MHWLTGWFRSKPQLSPEQQSRLSAWQALPSAELKTPVVESRCVVVDVETTGLNLMQDRLISMGAVAVVNGKIALGDSFYVVLPQQAASDKGNILLHGISTSVQLEGEPPVEALLSFLEFLGKPPLIAFHLTFDETMINHDQPVAPRNRTASRADRRRSERTKPLPDCHARATKPAVAYAAGELQKFIEEITGVRLPVVSEKEVHRGPAFLLGPCRRTMKAGLVEQAAKLREDGVLLKTVGKDVALLGQNERGTLYSIYVLLEEYWGVRFLAWDSTVVPRRAELSLPEVDCAYTSPFMYRETLTFESLPKEIAARQRLKGRQRGGTQPP